MNASKIKEHFPHYSVDVSHYQATAFGESTECLPFIGQYQKYDMALSVLDMEETALFIV